ncbi:MAG: hypothetical protein D6706_16950 [Chloroflexi bacterium]|nr:MAG: hypothetical protein D6706_16950 [Chloroflexota bacterium]
MLDDFDALRDDFDFEEENALVADDQPAFDDMAADDEFDALRARVGRTGAMSDEMDDIEDFEPLSGSGFAFSLSNFTPGQRLILALLLLLDVVAVGFGALIFLGVIG